MSGWIIKGPKTAILAIKPRRQRKRTSIGSLDTANQIKFDVAAQAAALQAAQNRPKSLDVAIRREIKNLGLEKSVRFNFDSYFNCLTFRIGKMPDEKKLEELKINARHLCRLYRCQAVKIKFELVV